MWMWRAFGCVVWCCDVVVWGEVLELILVRCVGGLLRWRVRAVVIYWRWS